MKLIYIFLFDKAKPYKLKVVTTKQKAITPKLKFDKTKTKIIIDSSTELIGFPKSIFEYKIGNKTAIEWVLNQYRESAYNLKQENEKILSEKFNSYKFKHHKEYVIELIKKLCTISEETVLIINQMKF